MYTRKFIIAIITIIFVYIGYRKKDILLILGSFILGLFLMRIVEIIKKRKEEKELLKNIKEINNKMK